MLLHQLLKHYDPNVDLAGVADIEILGICEDSRTIKSGDVFGPLTARLYRTRG